MEKSSNFLVIKTDSTPINYKLIKLLYFFKAHSMTYIQAFIFRFSLQPSVHKNISSKGRLFLLHTNFSYGHRLQKRLDKPKFFVFKGYNQISKCSCRVDLFGKEQSINFSNKTTKKY